MSTINVLRDFIDNMVEFFDELIKQFPDEGDFVFIRIFIKDRVPAKSIMNHFICEILPLKEHVKQKNDKFFLNHNILFSQLDNVNKINHFKQLWQSNRLDNDDRDVIWRWFSLFIRLAEKYQEVKLRESMTY